MGLSSRTLKVIASYLKAGIFYVKNPNSAPSFTAALRGEINIPSSVDVAFANGGLTSSGGHPIQITQRQINAQRRQVSDGEGGFYFVIDDLAELNRKWPSILEGKPDFMKTYLIYSAIDRLRFRSPMRAPSEFLLIRPNSETSDCPQASSVRLPTRTDEFTTTLSSSASVPAPSLAFVASQAKVRR